MKNVRGKGLNKAEDFFFFFLGNHWNFYVVYQYRHFYWEKAKITPGKNRKKSDIAPPRKIFLLRHSGITRCCLQMYGGYVLCKGCDWRTIIIVNLTLMEWKPQKAHTELQHHCKIRLLCFISLGQKDREKQSLFHFFIYRF